MSYRLKKFVGDLPLYEAQHDISIGPVTPAYQETVNRGYYDADGAGDALMALRQISLETNLHATTAQALQDQVRVWENLVGARRKLWREEVATGNQQWIWARLEVVEISREWVNMTWLPATFRWSIIPPVIWNGPAASGMHHWDGDGQWNSSGWTFNQNINVFALDSNPKVLTVVNLGTATVDNVVVRLTAGVTQHILSALVTCNNEQAWRFENTIYSGQALVVDCGAKRVRNNGEDAFTHFAREPYHRTPQWLRLKPGKNDVAVTLVGGGADSTISFEFYHGYR